MDIRKVFKSLNISSDYYSDEVVKDFMGKYSRRESECLDRDTLFEILEDLSMRYVDIDNEDFEFEVQEIAKKLLKKLKKAHLMSRESLK